MKIFTKLTILVVLIGATSCAFHSGNYTSNAVIINKDFSVKGLAMGKAQTHKILGIGGLSKNALVYRAKKQMQANCKLQNGQAFTNITVDFKRSFFFIYSQTKVTVTAEIIDFQNISQPNVYDLIDYNGFKPGDSVYVKFSDTVESVEIIQLQMKTAEVMLHDSTTMRMKYKWLFKQNGSAMHKGETIHVGDSINIPLSSNTVYPAEIIGLSDKKILTKGTLHSKRTRIKLLPLRD
jgi:hypothetical protein